MQLYLARHGDYLPEEVDRRQPLSESGKRETHVIAEFLAHTDLEIDHIFHSEKWRAQETAEIIGNEMRPKKEVEKIEGIGPNDSVGPIIEEIYARKENLMLVSHLPFLQKLVSALIIHDENRPLIHLVASSVVCLEPEGGNWAISWMIHPKFIKSHARSH